MTPMDCPCCYRRNPDEANERWEAMRLVEKAARELILEIERDRPELDTGLIDMLRRRVAEADALIVKL